MKNVVFRSILTLFLFSGVASAVQAQTRPGLVNVTFALTPPYSSKISDYASIPGRAIITLNSSGGAGGTSRVYLRLTVTGDNGIVITTKQNYLPARPIEVQTGIPLVLDLQTLGTLFDVNSFDLTKISSRQILERDGLPEGNYQLCVRVYSYDNPGVAVSPEAPAGCVFIRLTQLEPPLLIKPFDKDHVSAAGRVQNVTFSWNIPAGSEPGTQYLLRIIEMLDPNKNPNDAMNSRTTPPFFETTTSANIIIYGPGQPAMVEGRKYAWAVTALPGPQGVAYRNYGRSEVRSFIYGEEIKLPSVDLQLGFLFPNSKSPGVKVNNQNDFMLFWNWIRPNATQQTVSEDTYKQFGVDKYELVIAPATETASRKVDKKFFYKTVISQKKGTLDHIFRKTEAEADEIGLKDGLWYKATITARNFADKLIQTAASVDFQYVKTSDQEPVFNTRVKAQFKYSFEGKSGIYSAANTPVEIQVLKKFNGVPLPGYPKVTVNGAVYGIVASGSQQTDANGNVEVNVAIPQSKFTVDTFYYRVNMSGAYYISDHFGLLAAQAVKQDTAVNFGQQIAKTYGYALKLNVSKAYPNYFVKDNGKGNLTITVDTSNKFSDDFTYDYSKGGMTYKSNKSKPEAGITVILYRKDKKSYVPSVEGNLAADNTKKGYVEVGREKTQIEILPDGTQQATVQFNNLLANLFTGDEYYTQALVDANNPNSDFIAPEVAVKIAKPVNISKPDSLYRNVKLDYKLISKKPPTSLVKGKLLYKWKSEGEKAQLRPVSNQTFTVIVDYLVGGNSIGSVKESSSNGKTMSYSEKFFVPQGSKEYTDGQQLLDFGQTMATGKTDAQGNFELEVVNFNNKGSLGKGQIVEQGWSIDKPNEKTKPANTNPADIASKYADPVINPWDGMTQNLGTFNSMPAGYGGYQQTGTFNAASQGALNAGMNGGFNLNVGNGFFEAGANVGAGFGTSFAPSFGMVQQLPQEQQIAMHGPAEGDDREAPAPDGDMVTLERVYRIIPTNFYLNPATETFAVQAFEAKTLQPATSIVKEVTVKVATKDKNGNKLTGMMVTIFRPLGSKTDDLPFGEGDGKYLQTQLINPQYKGTASDASFDNPNNSLNSGGLFTKKFEMLCPIKSTADDGMVSFGHLLYGYGYYVMACSDPSQGSKLYKATFTNCAYKDPTTIVLEPLPSRVIVRSKDNETQERLKYASVYINSKYATFTDYEGYAELKGSQLPLNPNKSVTMSVYATAGGYNKSATYTTTLDAVGAQYVKDLFLVPGATITGNLVSVDENKKAVKAYITSSSGKTVETDDKGNFSLAVPSLGNQELTVTPKDVAYFDSVLVIPNGAGAKTYKDLPIYRRKHRMMFTVVDAATHTQVTNAVVQLGDKTQTSSVLGLTYFEFENVSVNNYTFIIKGPKGSNYIPVTKNVKNEESKSYTIVKVELEKGSEVSGTVTLDNKPVKNARVYIEASNQQSGNGDMGKDANLLVAYTDAQGKYTLNGVPANNEKIHLIATLDTTFTVNGDNQVADIKSGKATTNLKLTTYNGMAITNVFGFPLSVEKITPGANADEVKVTGTIKWTNAISDFKWIQGNDILRVENVVFTAKTVNGKKIGEVKASSVEIEDAASIKLRYLDKYNVKLFKTQTYYIPGVTLNPLSITKENDYGVIRGKISIVDNSFNYPSSYINFTKKDQFYLATVANNTVNNTVNAVSSVVKVSTANNGGFANYTDLMTNVQNLLSGIGGGGSGSTSQPKVLYNISNGTGGNIEFKFIEFDATADAKNSFIAQDGKIHLNVNMACHVPNAQPENFDVNVSDVVLDDNKVYASSSSSPLELKLENWTLQVKNWKIDPKEGGIVSSNALIRTSKLDIPVKTFNLRSDMLVMQGFKLDQLTIGGGIKALSNIDTTNAALVFDNKTGMNMGPHWRFSMSSAGKPVAKLTGLPDMGVGEVGIDYIQLLSDDENIFQLTQAKEPLKLYNNGIAKFTPQSIMNGSNFFAITGALNTGAPRTGDMMLELNFSKETGALKMKPGNIKTDIEGKGFVHFTSIDGKNNISNIKIDATTITIDGEVVEKPNKSFNPVPATFVATASGNAGSYKVDLQKNYVMQLTTEVASSSSSANPADGYKLTLDKGGMEVGADKDWGILTYSGLMESNMTDSSKGIQPMYVDFKVLGDVSVDGSGAKMNNVETSFGKLTMIFDFPNKKLMGTLKMQDVKLGTNTVNGTVETLFEPKGFYVAGGGTVQVNVGNPIADGTYNLGFMIGSYPLNSDSDPLWKTVTAYKQPEVTNNCYVGKLKGRLKGFYMTADRIVLDKSADFDFILVSGYVRAKAIIGADMYANFSGETTMGVAVQIYAHGAAGMSAITGTSMNGSAEARAGVVMKYEGGKFNLDAKIDVSFTAEVKQFVLLGTLSASKSVGASAHAGTGGFSLDLTNGDKLNPCY